MRVGVVVVCLAGCGRLAFAPLPDGGATLPDGATPDVTTDVDAGDAADVAPVFTRIYGITYTTLHELDATTLAVMSNPALCPNQVLPTVTDLAFERDGSMIVATQPNNMYRASAAGADCTRLPDIPSRALAIDFVPRGVIDPLRDVLVIGAADQNLYRYYDDDTIQLVGPMGRTPAGDIAWTGSELLMSVQAGVTDELVRVDFTTGNTTTIGNLGTEIWGLSWFQGRLVGFADDGDIVEIDPATAGTTPLAAAGVIWSGAGTAP